MRLNRFGIKTVTGPWLSRFESLFPQTLMNILSESGTGLRLALGIEMRDSPLPSVELIAKKRNTNEIWHEGYDLP